MNNISKRLENITYFVNKNDKVVDVGCDHGLLSIYLYKNKLCKSVIATDVNANALGNAIKNIEKEKLPIKTFISDGIKDVSLTLFDTIIISGMGTSTILHILEDDKKLDNVKKIILQSNNDHILLRKEMNKKGYYLEDESIIKDGKKYYITMKYLKSKQKNTKDEIKYGLNKEDKKDYYEYLINNNLSIITKIPKRKYFLRLKYKKINKKLKKRIM